MPGTPSTPWSRWFWNGACPLSSNLCKDIKPFLRWHTQINKIAKIAQIVKIAKIAKIDEVRVHAILNLTPTG